MAKLGGPREAFGQPGIAPRWTHGDKDGVGTAYAASGRVWFTIWNGILTEVYYPTADRPQILQISEPHELVAAIRQVGVLVRDARRNNPEQVRRVVVGHVRTCKALAAANSDVELHSGAVTESADLVTYQSGGMDRGLSLNYSSLRADPEPLVWKALSWALRDLVKRDKEAVRAFVHQYQDVLASGITRALRSRTRGASDAT